MRDACPIADRHIVLHCVPAQGICLIDIVARDAGRCRKGIEVISRRLTR